MEIGNPKRIYTVEPIESPVPAHPKEPDEAPEKRPPAPAKRPAARA
jgi:hypothetical protein